MSLDEERVDWLNSSDNLTNTSYIRKPELAELKRLKVVVDCTSLTTQVLNWFFYLEGVPPLGRKDQYDYNTGRYKIIKGLNKFYNKDLSLKEDYWYLEELYKIIREES